MTFSETGWLKMVLNVLGQKFLSSLQDILKLWCLVSKGFHNKTKQTYLQDSFWSILLPGDARRDAKTTLVWGEPHELHARAGARAREGRCTDQTQVVGDQIQEVSTPKRSFQILVTFPTLLRRTIFWIQAREIKALQPWPMYHRFCLELSGVKFRKSSGESLT